MVEDAAGSAGRQTAADWRALIDEALAATWPDLPDGWRWIVAQVQIESAGDPPRDEAGNWWRWDVGRYWLMHRECIVRGRYPDYRQVWTYVARIRALAAGLGAITSRGSA